MTEVRGIPDRSAVPTLCMNYQSTATLTIAPGQATPWAWDMTLLPHPIFFACWSGQKAYDPTFNITGEGNFQNVQLAPLSEDPSQLTLIWKALAKRWRICYESVTVLQDGPDLANQGTIAVSQTTFEPRTTHFGTIYPPTPDGTSRLGHFYPLVFYDQATEGPNFERTQAMPNAMIGRSRDGAYVPLKLTDTCQQWQSEKDFVIPTNRGYEHPHPAEGWVDAQATMTPAYPFPRITPFHGSGNYIAGDYTPGLMNGSVAHICARNLSDQTSFTFQFRMGIEIQLDPSSTLTPQLKLSPPYDPVALDMYYRVARELKDAYPADYNVTGKLWSVISEAVKSIAPPLLTAVGAGQFIPAALGLVAAGDASVEILKNRRRKQKGKGPRYTRVPLVRTAPAPGSAPSLSQRFAAMSQGKPQSAATIEGIQQARTIENATKSGGGGPVLHLVRTRRGNTSPQATMPVVVQQ